MCYYIEYFFFRRHGITQHTEYGLSQKRKLELALHSMKDPMLPKTSQTSTTALAPWRCSGLHGGASTFCLTFPISRTYIYIRDYPSNHVTKSRRPTNPISGLFLPFRSFNSLFTKLSKVCPLLLCNYINLLSLSAMAERSPLYHRLF